MPIYAYRCERCGHDKDVIQKFSDAPLTVCPSCGADAFRKQLTAPAFQLKGSGWYVTDFRDQGGKAKAGDAKPGTDAAKPDAASSAPAAETSSGTGSGASSSASGSSSTGESSGSSAGPAASTPAST